MTKQSSDYWKAFFDGRAKHVKSDHELNRGTALRLSTLEVKAQRQFLEAVDPHPTDVVLDAGCGSGRNIFALSPLVAEIVGLDYSEHMLRRADERVRQENCSNVKLVTGDVTRLQFESETFDKVVCASVLQYLDDECCALALREMVRVCKQGGRMILHIKNGTSLYGLSIKVLRPLARLFGKEMKPEFYRSRRWHERQLQAHGGRVLDYDGFGILTFVPLPGWAVDALLRCEIAFDVPKKLKKLAVNYQMTVQVVRAAVETLNAEIPPGERVGRETSEFSI